MIALGCDHGGYELMQEVKQYLDQKGYEYEDFGCHSTEATDYPIYAKKVAQAILSGKCDKGILICGTGMGGRVVGPGLAIKIVETFLTTPFSGAERHCARIAQMEQDID